MHPIDLQVYQPPVIEPPVPDQVPPAPGALQRVAYCMTRALSRPAVQFSSAALIAYGVCTNLNWSMIAGAGTVFVLHAATSCIVNWSAEIDPVRIPRYLTVGASGVIFGAALSIVLIHTSRALPHVERSQPTSS